MLKRGLRVSDIPKLKLPALTNSLHYLEVRHIELSRRVNTPTKSVTMWPDFCMSYLA